MFDEIGGIVILWENNETGFYLNNIAFCNFDNFTNFPNRLQKYKIFDFVKNRKRKINWCNCN